MGAELAVDCGRYCKPQHKLTPRCISYTQLANRQDITNIDPVPHRG